MEPTVLSANATDLTQIEFQGDLTLQEVEPAASSKVAIDDEETPEIVPLHISCSQRPDWTCGPCSAYGTKKPWELV